MSDIADVYCSHSVLCLRGDYWKEVAESTELALQDSTDVCSALEREFDKFDEQLITLIRQQ